MSARLAVDAPVTIFRVYWMCPGVSAIRTAQGGAVTVGDVDRDPLFAFGPKAVGQQGEVDVFVPSFLAAALDGFKLILEDRLGVMKESTDKGALPVVHAARGGEPQEIHVQVIVFFSH